VHFPQRCSYSNWKASCLADARTLAPEKEVTIWIAEITRNGDVRDWGRIFERFKKPVFSMCFRLLGNEEDARDATSDAFIKALENLDQYDRSRPFFPWLCRIVRNLCIDRIRRDQRVRFVRPADWEGIGAVEDPADGDADHGVNEGIRKAIDRLKPAQRMCFCLFYLHEKSYDDIVRLTGYTRNQVRSHIQNGRRKLRLELEP
jgi:RNA polymerase sigma-70 factor, ECF subfamily